MPSMWDLEESDFEPYDECDQPLTDDQIKAVRNMAYRRAVQMMRQGHWSSRAMVDREARHSTLWQECAAASGGL